MKKIIIGCIIVLLLTACSEERITDPVTELTIPILEATEEHYIFQTLHHGMMASEKMDFVHQKLIFDLSHYTDNPISRGDVVIFKLTEDYKKLHNNEKTGWIREEDISRIIALPGEKFAIKKGQIYINGMKLDTFYGKLKYDGFPDPKSLFPHLNACEKKCQEEIKDYFRLTLEEIEVPPDHVFLLSDNSDQAFDSRDVGPVPIDLILGKFLGYAKEK